MKPIRPPRITAAAVLLIALGGQFVVAFAGYAFLALFGRTTGLLDRLILPEWCWFFTTPVLALLGIDFLRVGISILYGYRNEILVASFRIAGFGALAVFLCSVVLIAIVADMNGKEIGRMKLADFLLAGVPIAFDSVAILVAGILLRNQAESYLEWKKTISRPPEKSSYEEEK